MIQHLFKRLLLIVGVSASLTALQYNPSLAASFDPGYIISDSIFTNSTSMSASSVQYFINVKGASCVDGEAPCLKNYSENGKSAATIIAEAAQAYSINPQVLLTTLQKETGLVTISQPGAWRYRTAMGYGCPDTAACDAQYYGFTNQMNRAASMFHRIMIYDPTWYSPYQVGLNFVYYNPVASCGGTNVNIQNRATAALYDYTPYQPNAAALTAGYGTGDACSTYGNRNFWLYFNSWFGSSISSILIQSPQSPAVYLQSGNTRYGIPSWDVIDAYGFGRFGVTAVSDSYMNTLQDGGVLSTIFTNKAYPGPVYLADNGYRFGFSSYQQCVDWGFPDCTNANFAKALEPSVFDRMYVYGDLSPLMLNGKYVSLMKNGTKQVFLGNSRAESAYASTPYSPITSPLNTRQPYGASIMQNNSMVSFKGNGVIYAYNNDVFYPLTYDAFRSLVSPSTPIIYDDFSSYLSTPPAPGPTIPPYVSLSDGSVYVLSAGGKINITPIKSDWPTPQDAQNLKTLLDRKVTTASPNAQSTYRTESGTILKVEGKKWRGFYSLYDYFSLGYSNPIAVSNDFVTTLPVGNPVFAPGYGSLFQESAPGKESYIYTTSNDGTICQIYTLPQLGLYKFNTTAVYRLPGLPSATVNQLSTNVYDQNGDLHIVYSGVHSVMSKQSLQSIWGISTPLNICGLQTSFLSKNAINKPSPRFIRDENTGVIYYGENSTKRAIFSYGAFLRMGGNGDNTQNVSQEFLNSSPDGSPIYS